jgi:Leucine-rich repeat (LRR) protein
LWALDICNNCFTAIDVRHNHKLEYLKCFGNNISVLDVSQNKELEYLDCEHTSLTFLDLSKNKKLKELYCSVIDSNLMEGDIITA